MFFLEVSTNIVLPQATFQMFRIAINTLLEQLFAKSTGLHPRKPGFDLHMISFIPIPLPTLQLPSADTRTYSQLLAQKLQQNGALVTLRIYVLFLYENVNMYFLLQTVMFTILFCLNQAFLLLCFYPSCFNRLDVPSVILMLSTL